MAAATRWIEMVRTSQLGEHPYRMTGDEAAKFLNTPAVTVPPASRKSQRSNV